MGCSAAGAGALVAGTFMQSMQRPFGRLRPRLQLAFVSHAGTRQKTNTQKAGGLLVVEQKQTSASTNHEKNVVHKTIHVEFEETEKMIDNWKVGGQQEVQQAEKGGAGV